MLFIHPPEMLKILDMCRPYWIPNEDNYGLHWDPNTPQEIMDKWKEYQKWYKKMEDLHEYEK